MKKYLLLVLAIALKIASLHAQDIVIKASKKVSIQATPKQIIDSLKKRFPNAQAVQSYKTSSTAAKNGWKVNEQDNLGSDDLDMYTLSFKRDDFNYYALYQSDGTLVRAKFQQNGVTMPDVTRASLKQLAGDNYKDYKLISNTYYKTFDYGSKKSYYEVVAVNKAGATVKKKITLDDTGKVVKVQ